MQGDELIFTSCHLLQPLLPTKVQKHARTCTAYLPSPQNMQLPHDTNACPALTLMLVPAMNALISVHMHASMDTHNCGSFADMFCNEVVGVLHHQLPQTNTNTNHLMVQCWLEHNGSTLPCKCHQTPHIGIDGPYEHKHDYEPKR